MKTSIAILVKEFPPNVIGGTETQTMRMATELQKQSDTEVTVYTKSYPNNQDKNSHPYEIIRVPNWSITPFISTLSFVIVATLLLIRDADRYDVLQCMMIYPNGFVGYIVNRIRGLPYFAWIRGGDYYFMKDNPVKRQMMRRVLTDTTVLVQTDRIAADVRSEFSPINLKVLGNGVDVPETRADGDKIVFVGRLASQKGVDVLLKAVSQLPDSVPVLIVGDGSEREQLESMADRLGVDAEFTGEVPPSTVSSYLKQGKVFILPAVKGEGLPNAMLEAMASGLPVVATDTGGIADCIEDGETGYVVPTDDVDALRDRIERLCMDDIHRRELGYTARGYVRDTYGWATIVDDIEAIYDYVTEQQ